MRKTLEEKYPLCEVNGMPKLDDGYVWSVVEAKDADDRRVAHVTLMRIREADGAAPKFAKVAKVIGRGVVCNEAGRPIQLWNVTRADVVRAALNLLDKYRAACYATVSEARVREELLGVYETGKEKRSKLW